MSSSQKHPLGYDSKTAKVSSGHHYRYVDIHPPQGVKTIVTALVLHGFPDSAYGWRHQVKGWSQRGIRLIVPDTLGYTGSSQPTNPEDYSLKTQSEDLSELVHIAGVPKDEKIILIAHDWGAGIANRLAQFKPELVKGAANLCVPFSAPPLQYMTIEQYVERLPNFQYQLFFASPHSDAIIDSNLEKFMSLIYASAKQYASGEAPPFEKEGVVEAWLKDDSKSIRSALLSEEEFSTIVSQIRSGVGFSAMLNYYRTRKINYELEKGLPQDYRPDMPKLMVVPSADPAIPAALSAYAEKQLKAVEVAWLEGLCGHWVQLEKPEEVERVVGNWVERMHAKGWEA